MTAEPCDVAWDDPHWCDTERIAYAGHEYCGIHIAGVIESEQAERRYEERAGK